MRNKQVTSHVLALLLILCLIAVITVPVAGAAGTAQISFGEVYGRAGENVTVPVTITNNPGIASFRFRIAYDAQALTYVSAQKGEAMTGGTLSAAQQTPEDKLAVTWFSVSNVTGDGVLFELTFRVSQEKEGRFPLTVSYLPEDIVNASWQQVDCTVMDGAVLNTPGTVVFQNWDGTVISSEKYYFGDSVKIPADPVRATDGTYVYTFAGWDKEVKPFSQDAVYTATYHATYGIHVVTFRDWDGTVISSERYCPGDRVVVPSDPVRASDPMYHYSFRDWGAPVAQTCQGDAEYTANYQASFVYYDVTFENEDGTVLSSQPYRYGQTVQVPADPVKASDPTFRYVFSGWDTPVAAVTADTVYTAVFRPEYIDYTVTFCAENGAVISSGHYHYGDKVSVPVDPVKASDQTYTYHFAGWDQEVTDCVADAVYTATFESRYIDYAVTFRAEDGSTIQSKIYHYGDEVTAPAAPEKPADPTYIYTFAGWDQPVTDCFGDAVYTATYEATYIEYTIVFRDWDGTVLSSRTYHYGDTVIRPAAPERPADKTYTYAFSGWDKEVVPCQADAVYTATYEAALGDYIITFLDWDGSVIAKKICYYGDVVEQPAAPARPADKVYAYTFAGWDREVVPCQGNASYMATYTQGYIDYTVTFCNDDASQITSATYHYGDKIVVPADPAKAADNTYTYVFSGWDQPVSDCVGNAVYTATYQAVYIDYTVSFRNWDGSELSVKTYHFGDIVDVPAAPERPADKTYTYVFSGWDQIVGPVTGDAVYTARFTAEYILYTVVFRNWDGSLLSSGTYHYGSQVELPPNPSKPSDETYNYAFVGWSPEVTEVTGDAEYTACYEEAYGEYTVTFCNEDGSVIATGLYHYGQMVTIPAAPSKTADKTYTYQFAGWDQPVLPCNGNAVYKATYTAHYIDYTVTFCDEDGSILERRTYHWSDPVTAPADPSKPADKTYTYRFVGWDQPVSVCQGDVTYTAAYEAVYIEYMVIFQYEDGTVIRQDTLHYGQSVEAPAAPAAPDASQCFVGWDKEITPCYADAVYTAVFEQVYLRGDFNEDGKVNDMDAIYLLRHTLLPSRYPVNQDPDVNADGKGDDVDAIYLLRHTLLPNRYPLLSKKED